ncbi:MAG: fumarate hydratase C-terminal domain-containing protein [Bradymonadales bacterium]|nr:fumarate hydratase C-terminal domain-containing protein [Bradymonadales bacterium]
MTIELTLPTDEATIRSLNTGDFVEISGMMVTGRDAAHTYLVETFRPEYQKLLEGRLIYHCGPVVRQRDGRWEFVSAGPTTSIREEPYQADVIERYGLRGVVGKGGMGAKTLAACQRLGAVYLHAVGGAGASIAASVKQVLEVRMLEEFGVPEAFWVIEVERFPAIVTMDSHGHSLHDEVERHSRQIRDRLIG